MHIVRDLVHCDAMVFKPGQTVEESESMHMWVFARFIDGKWQYSDELSGGMKGSGFIHSFIHPVMVITLTPLAHDCPVPPFRSYVEMEIDETGSVDEFFQDFCEDIVAMAARRLESRVQSPHWTTFTILCEGVYDPSSVRIGFELEVVREIDYDKLESAVKVDVAVPTLDPVAEIERLVSVMEEVIANAKQPVQSNVMDASYCRYCQAKYSDGFAEHDDLCPAAVLHDALTANVPLPPELSQHTRFVLESPAGNVGFVHGDPDMSEETKHALRQLIDAAYKAVDKGEIEPDEDDSVSTLDT